MPKYYAHPPLRKLKDLKGENQELDFSQGGKPKGFRASKSIIVNGGPSVFWAFSAEGREFLVKNAFLKGENHDFRPKAENFHICQGGNLKDFGPSNQEWIFSQGGKCKGFRAFESRIVKGGWA